MIINFDNETEEHNNFWFDVYLFMEENNCSKEAAIAEVSKIYYE